MLKYTKHGITAWINSTGTTNALKQNPDKNVLTCRQQYATRHHLVMDKERQSHLVTSAKSILTTILVLSAYHPKDNAI